ncbi:MAG TPA: S8 family serine peptidase, partial [Cyclobacteriaceae bacterium]|nr:S8 family serine peptidase [Cyclobacteriaceae bacterium]
MTKQLPAGKRCVIGVRSFLLFVIVFLTWAELSAQNTAERNEHVIHVKFKPYYGSALGNGNGMQRFGLKSLDAMNAVNRVSSSTRIFPHAGKFEDAHRAFGLHLWYEIRVPKDKPIADILSRYRNLEYFDRVEERAAYSIEKYNEIPSPILSTQTSDPLFLNQWHFKNTGQTGGTAGADISLTAAWQLETGNSDVIVAVIDGGIQLTHPDLRDAIWINPNEVANGLDDDHNGYIDDINGYDFGDDSSIIPVDKHATHVAGIIGAVTNNGIGVSGIAGGSGNGDGVRLMSCVGFGQSHTGGFEAAMVYAADNGAVIGQNSWGGGSSSIEAAIDYFVNRAGLDNSSVNFNARIQTGPIAGGIVVFAAGNDDSNDPAHGYPASYSSAIAVASTDSYGAKSSFSNWGTWVDISAPGSNITSTFPVFLGSYGTLSGTSMACPQVSGVAALMISKFRNQSLTASDIRNRLLNAADREIYSRFPYSMGIMGSGGLNAYRALLVPDGVAPSQIIDVSFATISYNSVTLSWTAPGADGQTGTAFAYDVRYSNVPITEANFYTVPKVSDVQPPHVAGTEEHAMIQGLSQNQQYYFAVKTIDYFYNTSPMSNVASVTLPGPPTFSTPPNSFEQTLYSGGTAVKNITVSNVATGGADLIVKFSTTTAYSWLRVDPVTYSIPPGSSKDVPVYISTMGASNGSAGVINIVTNDPGRPLINAIFTLFIAPAPDIELASSNVDFGETYISYPKDSAITIKNSGLQNLVISEIRSDNPLFSYSISKNVFVPGDKGTLTISFTPGDNSNQSGNITIISNDPDEATLIIPVTGHGGVGPTFDVVPGSINLTLPSGGSDSRTVTISNTGAGTLRWKAVVNAPTYSTTSSGPSDGESTASNDFVELAPSPKRVFVLATDPNSGIVYGTAMESSDFYAYDPVQNKWNNLDSRPGIGASQFGVFLNGAVYCFIYDNALADWSLASYAIASGTWKVIPRPFPFGPLTTDGRYIYLAWFRQIFKYDPLSNTTTESSLSNEVRFGINGGIAFNKGIIYGQEGNPFTGDGNTSIAKYFPANDSWEPAARLTGKGAPGGAIDPIARKFYVPSNGNSIISIYDLDADVWEKKQFAGVTDPSNFVYVGKQNVSGIYFTHSGNKFARFSAAPLRPWLKAESATGTTDPAVSEDISVTISAENLNEGTYSGSVKIAAIANASLQKTVPVNLTVVGIPKIAVNKNVIEFKNFVYVNARNALLYLTVANIGTGKLSISNILSDHPDFTTDITSIDLVPGQRKDIGVIFAPTTAGIQNGVLSFVSDDPNQGTIQVGVRGEGLIPPTIDASPTSLTINALAGDKKSFPVTVANNGGSTLYLASYALENWLGTLIAYDPIIPVGATGVINILCDATAKAPGTYSGTFVMFHGFLDQVEARVPVTMNVTSAPGISISGSGIIDFGEAYLNSPAIFTTRIRN